MPEIKAKSTEFVTPWFEVIAKKVDYNPEPFFSLQMLDYVSILPITFNQEVVLVQQYRPAIENFSLEFPSGHIEKDETPEESARRELNEETGFNSDNLELLGVLNPDTGRLQNRLWCYLAPDAKKNDSIPLSESGIEVILVPLNQLSGLISDGKFNHALNLALITLAFTKHPQIINFNNKE